MSLRKVVIYTLFCTVLFGCNNVNGIVTNSAQQVSYPKNQEKVNNDVLNKKDKKQAPLIVTLKSNTNNQPQIKKTKSKELKPSLPNNVKPINGESPKDTQAISQYKKHHQKKEPKDLVLEKTLPKKLENKSNNDKKNDHIEEVIKFEAQTFPNFYAPERFNHPLQHSKKLTFMIGEDSLGSYLYGEGPIIEGAYNKFLKYVQHYQKLGIKLNRLMLHSPGGVLNEGILIGKYIQKNQWTTDADMYMRCYSTCGFIYAAGAEKRIQTGAEIGFHRPYLPHKADTPEFIKQVYDEYKTYWQAVSGSTTLYDKFMREYDRNNMYILNDQNIQNYMFVEKY
ncbi:hypothetical protein [Aliivibrio fischeri]|uniref:hypothetical protein n=1 Tax=Aliivibrio fischeri TaxID=668 RepID=UPI003553D69B